MAAGHFFRVLAAATALLVVALGAKGQAAEGPLKVATGSYKYVDRSEPLVATDRQVDLWAEVYRPKKLGSKPLPLIVFLHGNHGTCGRFDEFLGVRVDDNSQYTRLGTCPKGYEVTPNHLGYEYLARELASWGYVVVSINANRGITAGSGVGGDSGLNLMRGRLILRHLALLSDWSRGQGSIAPPASLGFDPKGALDFAQVGLMGHSRGGEGARAALQQYRDADSPFTSLIGPMTIRSIFEIGPVDGQTGRVLDADGVNSMILLPTCDGDVSDLEGVHVFDRVFARGAPADGVKAIHGTIAVWGANHNAYNSEWLTSDSSGCVGSGQLFPESGRSTTQQATALGTLTPFFRATVGPDAQAVLANLFDPTAPLPAALTAITRYDRGYLRGPINDKTVVLERFSRATGKSDDGVPTTTVGVTVKHGRASYEHDGSVRVARVRWNASSPADRYFQVNFGDAGRDLSGFRTLAFRVALRCFGKICDKPASDDGEMDFTISLMSGETSSRALRMVGRTRLGRPVGAKFRGPLHSVLYTVAIPLKDFGSLDLSKVTAVRFTFERKAQGKLDISHLTASTFPTAGTGASDVADAGPRSMVVVASADGPRPASAPAADGNRIAIVRGEAGPASASAGTPGGEVSIVLTSKRAFPVTGALPRLTVGSTTIRGGDLSADGRTLTVKVPAAEFEALDGEVSLDALASEPVWTFGRLPK